MECPICYETTINVFTNITCGHTWCKQCHHKMVDHKHTTCPICRDSIRLKRRPKPKNEYIDWLIEGGVPVVRWRNKRWRKRDMWRR